MQSYFMQTSRLFIIKETSFSFWKLIIWKLLYFNLIKSKDLIPDFHAIRVFAHA